MPDAGISPLVLLVIVFLVHGWLEFAHAGLVNLRRTPLRDRAETGDRAARRLLRLAEDPARFVVTKQIVQMALRFTAAVIVVQQWAEPVFASAAEPWVGAAGFAGVLALAVLILYVLGDLIPSALGTAWSDSAMRWSARPLRLLLALFRPLTAVLIRLDRAIAALAHGDALGKSITEEEIKTLVEEAQEGGGIEDEEKEMIYSVLDFGETLAREVMIPRPDMVAVDCDTTLATALKTFIDSGHSRVPVYDDSLDDIRGLLYAKDLLTLWQQGAAMDTPIRHALRQPYFVPETKLADALFREMQEKKVHIAIIVDEYGGTAGLVTIEDLIEEIVGDIRDEYDIHEEAEYLPLGPDEWLIDGAMNIDDVNDLLEIELPRDDHDSLGGYVYSMFGRVPEVGETLDDEACGISLRIESIDNRRIRKVYVKRHPRPVVTDEDEHEDAGRSRGKKDVRLTDTTEVVTVKDEE